MLNNHQPAIDPNKRKPLRRHSITQKPQAGMANTSQNKPIKILLFDRWLLAAVVAVMLLGIMMVYSASIVVSEKMFGEPFYFVMHQMVFIVAGLVLAAFLLRVEMKQWEEISTLLLFISFISLILVLIPGVGRQVNGSMRWVGFAGVGFQVSEFAKFVVVIYLARYLVKHHQAVTQQFSGFLKPMIILGIIALLLLKEPDFGSTVVIMTTALGMLFLAGARLWQFGCLFGGVAASLVVLAISSPYRMARLTGFLDPWANPYDSGYQLTQSLIAFGRGSLFGVGLGESVQKLFYLPEAHTDFLFSVLAEELGLVGCLAVIVLFAIIVYRTLCIGREAASQSRWFQAYVAYGFALWIAMQATVNIGVSSGLLPTKGLTLPLMSYGGSSVLIMCMVFAVLFRIDYENRLERFGLARNKIRRDLKFVNRKNWM
ncbi:MAG: ftsW [Gammaproteobacteria bacterium]|jgi:cell division protein FtsW|nr:ftsW [Gammaproteobacteria bacterium]